MAKRLTKLQKKEIIEDFQEGKSLLYLSQKFGCTKITISRNIKKILGKERFENIKNNVELNLSSFSDKFIEGEQNKKNILLVNKNIEEKYEESKVNSDVADDQFYEIVPVNQNIDESFQKDLSSLPIKSVELPNVVYMIIDKQIDLCCKPLRDYPEWSFLPQQDLNRLSLEIFDDHNYAKKLCSKSQKLIKIPNPNVFLIASNSLKSKGITRIIFNNLLLAL